MYGDDDAVIRNIQLKGSKVRVYGKDLQGVQNYQLIIIKLI